MTRQFGLVRWLVPIQCLRLGSARLRPLGRAIPEVPSAIRPRYRILSSISLCVRSPTSAPRPHLWMTL